MKNTLAGSLAGALAALLPAAVALAVILAGAGFLAGSLADLTRALRGGGDLPVRPLPVVTYRDAPLPADTLDLPAPDAVVFFRRGPIADSACIALPEGLARGTGEIDGAGSGAAGKGAPFLILPATGLSDADRGEPDAPRAGAAVRVTPRRVTVDAYDATGAGVRLVYAVPRARFGASLAVRASGLTSLSGSGLTAGGALVGVGATLRAGRAAVTVAPGLQATPAGEVRAGVVFGVSYTVASW